MATVTIQEAQARLSDLIHQLSPGEEEDDEHLEDFKEYMPGHRGRS